jgi:hypothetical protein
MVSASQGPSSRRRALSGLCRCRLQAADITHSANRWLHGWLAYDVAAGIPGGTTLRLTGSSDHLRGVVQVREANRRGKCVVARDEGGRVPPGRVRVDVPGAQFPTDSCPQRGQSRLCLRCQLHPQTARIRLAVPCTQEPEQLTRHATTDDHLVCGPACSADALSHIANRTRSLWRE